MLVSSKAMANNIVRINKQTFTYICRYALKSSAKNCKKNL